MQLSLLLALFCLTPGLAAQASPGPPDGTTVSPPDRSFSIQFPAAPTEKVEKNKTAGSTIEIKTYWLAPAGGNPGFFLSYSARLAGSAPAPPPDSHLEQAKKAVLATTQGRLVSEKKITLGSHPGLELHIAAPMNSQLRTRIYVVQGRLYQVFVVGSPRQMQQPAVERFLNSFKLRAD